MKKQRVKKPFLEELRKNPIIESVCQKLQISRNTYYRWLAEDPEFAKEAEKAQSMGNDRIDDLAENMHITLIKDGEWLAIRYRLDSAKERRLLKSNMRSSKTVSLHVKDTANATISAFSKNEDNDFQRLLNFPNETINPRIAEKIRVYEKQEFEKKYREYYGGEPPEIPNK